MGQDDKDEIKLVSIKSQFIEGTGIYSPKMKLVRAIAKGVGILILVTLGGMSYADIPWATLLP